MDEILTLWTIRIALAFYVLVEAAWLGGARRRALERAARWAWTLGCAFYLVHVCSAFHFYHDWSHSLAYQATARQTQELFGFDWGGGLYLNYAFTTVWLLDAVWCWLSPEGYRTRPRWFGPTVHSFMAFMAFNATVVFAQGVIRWLGLVATIGLGVLWCRCKRNRRRRPSDPTARPD